jgi:hypothetical protein
MIIISQSNYTEADYACSQIRRVLLYLTLFCVNQWEEEKYFILICYWSKSKGTLAMSL